MPSRRAPASRARDNPRDHGDRAARAGTETLAPIESTVPSEAPSDLPSNELPSESPFASPC